MRRKEREVTDKNRIIQIMKSNKVCRLGFVDEDSVYILPLSFGLLEEDEQLTLYFHSAMDGKKVGLIAQTDVVGFEMDGAYELIAGDEEEHCTVKYQSIIGKGKLSIVEEAEEKNKGLSSLMAQHLGERANWKFPQDLVDRTLVFKIEITKMSCKVHE